MKRRKKSPAARLRRFWILFVLLVIAGAVGGYYAATWPGFLPKHVIVEGNRLVSARSIAERAAISSRINMWLQNMGAAANRVAAIPYIAEVHIYRIPPATVRIAVTERVPYAIVQTGADTAIVDRDLRVLEEGGVVVHGDRETVELPPIGLATFRVPSLDALSGGAFLRNADLLRLRDDYETLRAAHVAVQDIALQRDGELIAQTRGGVRVLLGDDGDLPRKARLIDPILSQVGAQGRVIASVDLRAPNTPVVVYR